MNKNKIKLSFNIHSTADWLALVGIILLVIQFVAQACGWQWSSENTNQVMNLVNTVISVLVSLGLLRNTEPTNTDKDIANAVKDGEVKQ